MFKVLLVKTSSLGDVVHNFPVVNDIRKCFPDARIDWVVEEAYVPLVRLHPEVARVIPVAIRRWRRRPLLRATWSEIAGLRKLFRDDRYDAVIDAQGLIKSALIARAAGGRRHGFDAASARESLAARLYDVTHHVPRDRHAVLRNRQLAAAALGYRIDSAADYGIALRSGASPMPERQYCVLLHATSREDKCWPEQNWIALGRELEARGLASVLPWGSDSERARSARIAAELNGATVLSLLPMGELAGLLGHADAVVGVDTGLSHLAAALGAPIAAIYSGSDPSLTGLHCARRGRNLGGPGANVGVAEVLRALSELGAL